MAFTLHLDLKVVGHIQDLGEDARELIREKLTLVVENPFRNKALFVPGHRVFRIRFTDRRREKRLIYEVVGRQVIVRDILDREDGYRDLLR